MMRFPKLNKRQLDQMRGPKFKKGDRVMTRLPTMPFRTGTVVLVYQDEAAHGYLYPEVYRIQWDDGPREGGYLPNALAHYCEYYYDILLAGPDEDTGRVIISRKAFVSPEHAVQFAYANLEPPIPPNRYIVRQVEKVS